MVTFGAPTAALVAIEPLAAPAGAIFLAHGLAVLHIQAGRGARGRWFRSGAIAARRRRPAPSGARSRPALGLLGDLVGHQERELLARDGPGAAARAAGRLAGRRGGGADGPARRARGWTAGACGWRARRAARRAIGWPTCCWRCARTSGDLRRSPTSTSRARAWRVRMRLPQRSRPALDAARRIARGRAGFVEPARRSAGRRPRSTRRPAADASVRAYVHDRADGGEIGARSSRRLQAQQTKLDRGQPPAHGSERGRACRAARSAASGETSLRRAEEVAAETSL